MKIIINKAQCNRCKDIIESTHHHDFVTCKCWNGRRGIAVDGGKDYIRRLGALEDIKELSEYDEISS